MSEGDEKVDKRADEVAGTPTEPSAPVEPIDDDDDAPAESVKPDPTRPTELALGADAKTKPELLRKATIAPPSTALGAADTPGQSRDAYVGWSIDGRYKVLSFIAEGGMGVVYKAQHTKIDRLVALKILRADFVKDREVTDRFLTEAKAASAIGNVRIVDVFDFGELPDGAAYLAMEYLDGDPLSVRIKKAAPFETDLVIHVAKQVAEALHAAHEAGIVHRDLKPDNVFLVEHDKDPNFVKILDFGIAKVAGGDNKLTRAGTIFGTPHYMSPEQGSAAAVDRRSDLYALGVIMYEMVSGRVPFEGDTPLALVAQHLYEPPPSISEVDSNLLEVPPGLEAVILKCLSKLPENRYRDMTELVEELERVERNEIPLAVDDLASRDAEFDVPQEQLERIKKRASALERRPSRWPIYAGAVGVAALTIALVARSGTDSVDELTAGAGGTPGAEASTTAEEGQQETSRVVALVVSPIDARAFLGDEDLGTMPISVAVPEGEARALELRRDGFYPETVTVDGSTSPIVVRLKPVPGAKPSEPVPDAGIDDIVKELEEKEKEKQREKEKAAAAMGVDASPAATEEKTDPDETEKTPAAEEKKDPPDETGDEPDPKPKTPGPEPDQAKPPSKPVEPPKPPPPAPPKPTGPKPEVPKLGPADDNPPKKQESPKSDPT